MSSVKRGEGHRRVPNHEYEDVPEDSTGPKVDSASGKVSSVAAAPSRAPTEASTERSGAGKAGQKREKSEKSQNSEKNSENSTLLKFKAQVARVQHDVYRLEARSDLTPREANELREKTDFLNSLGDEINSTEYLLPQEYVTAEGHIDRKRKQELLTPHQSAEPTDKRVRAGAQWELDQLKKAQEIVSANPDVIAVAQSDQYDFVFDETQFVDFDQDSELPGDESAAPVKSSSHEIQQVRKSLPVYKLRTEFLQAIDQNQVLIVVGETGSGKTTQLPQYLYEAGYTKREGNASKIRKVGCTQPRRVAATSVAARVAEEVGCTLGKEVGYSVRFDNTLGDQTHIKYVTDGMLLREFLSDPLLSGYSALMIDEAHERTVSTEIVLTLLKDIIKERADLKVIVASATINADKFSVYFDGAPIFKIPGRRFPVDICYTKQPEANYIQAAITTVFQIHMKEELGDILVFLTGQDEIESVEETLNEACRNLGDLIQNMIVAPIYANMPPKLQKRIFDPTPPHSRKVVLATNIAETSITIDGIRYVVDPGYVKENVFSPTTGMDSLVVVPCSRASADQRAGRAGRVGPGKCYRLFTKWSFYNELEANPKPEILRVNLATVVLLLLSMGITDLVHFDFMDPPSTQTLMKSLELLYALGALNVQGSLTSTGRRMAEFPMDPMFGKCLLTSSQYGVTAEILSILAMLSESSNLFFRPKDRKEQADKRKESFAHELGDHFTLLNIWTEWTDTGYLNIWCEDNFLQYRTLKRIKDVRLQLEKLCEKVGLDTEHRADDAKLTKILKALFSGFFPNVARLSKTGAHYVLMKRNQPVYLHPSSGLFKVKPPPMIVLYHELVLTSKEYMRNCMVIEEAWLGEMANHYYREKDIKAARR